MPLSAQLKGKLKARLAAPANNLPHRCSIPGCGRPTMRAAHVGLAEFHCRYHVQRKARHGSHWCLTYKAPELRPYIQAAAGWLKDHREEMYVAHSLKGLEVLLRSAGRVVPVMDFRGLSVSRRAKVAFARLREAGVKAERLLCIFLGVAALIEDDWGAHRVSEFKIVQTAKAAHRLASGTHRKWELEGKDGRIRTLAINTYPKSAGPVLRSIGKAIAECCEFIERDAVPAVQALKLVRYGEHPSHLPGWLPPWERRR
jgi:hypothetical protein